MKTKILNLFTTIVSIAVLIGCGTDLDPTKDTDDDKPYDVCKYKSGAGTTDNCAFAVPDDGSCGDRAVKVKSEIPANEYSCVTDL